MYSSVETKVHMKLSVTGSYKQYKETVIFDQKEMKGILDLRSLGYYKIRHGVLQQNLSKCYHFESADRLCDEFNTLVNELKKGKKIFDQEKVSMARGQ